MPRHIERDWVREFKDRNNFSYGKVLAQTGGSVMGEVEPAGEAAFDPDPELPAMEVPPMSDPEPDAQNLLLARVDAIERRVEEIAAVLNYNATTLADHVAHLFNHLGLTPKPTAEKNDDAG